MGTATYQEQRTTLEVTKGTAARFRTTKLTLSARAGRRLTSDEAVGVLLDVLDSFLAQQATRKAAG